MSTSCKKSVSRLLCLLALLAMIASPMKAEDSVAPQNLLSYSGTLVTVAGISLPNTLGITFGLYAEASGGSALWMESQNVPVDGEGHYSVLLGSQTANGIPADLFTVGNARWLGIQVAGQGSENRVLLTNVPYAVQAGDSQTLGGRTAQEYALTSQLGEQIRKELVLAGYNVPSANAADALPRSDAQPTNPGPPADQVTLSSLNDKLTLMDAKLNSIIAKQNEPAPLFQWTICTEPSGGIGFDFDAELQARLVGEGRLGAEGFGNGVMGRLLGWPGVKAGVNFNAKWDLVKFSGCIDLVSAIQRLAAARAAQDGAATAQFYSTMQGPNGAAAGTTLLDKLAALDQNDLMQKMLGVATTLNLDPTVLKDTVDKITNLQLNGSPFNMLNSNDPNRTALLAALPIPANLKPVINNPASLLPDINQMINGGICSDPNVPLQLKPLVQALCSAKTNEQLKPLLTGLQTTVGQVNTTINGIKGGINDVLSKLGLPTIAGIQPIETMQDSNPPEESTEGVTLQ